MTAAEPPDETESTKVTSPWHRPRPGWTLFDSPWGTERRDQAELDPALNGHAAPANEGDVVAPAEPTSAADPPDAAPARVARRPPVWAGASTAAATPTASATATPQDVEVASPSPSTASSITAAESSATTSVVSQVGTDLGADLGVSADTDIGDVVTTGAPAEAGRVDATMPTAPPTSEDPIANDAVMAEAVTVVGEAPARPSDAASLDSGHDGSPVLVSAMDVDASADAETSASTLAAGAGSDAPEQRRRARHAMRATPWVRVRQVLALFVLACVLVGVGVGVFALVKGTWSINPVLSGSMRPGFAVGGVVISERVPVDQLALRDVIVFQDPLTPSEQIVHRIVGMSVARNGERIFLTQGDANVSRDPWRLQIPGGTAYRVRWSLPLLGYVAIAYENHRGIALIIAGVVLILVAILPIARARRRKAPRETPG
jgi:signal peptidase I